MPCKEKPAPGSYLSNQKRTQTTKRRSSTDQGFHKIGAAGRACVEPVETRAQSARNRDPNACWCLDKLDINSTYGRSLPALTNVLDFVKALYRWIANRWRRAE